MPMNCCAPGMFVKVSVILPEAKPVLAIPATAIMRAPSGDSVFVITGTTNLVVQQKLIRTGRANGDFISVETGLKAGDRVVSDGIFKLRNGMTVLENNETTPKPSYFVKSPIRQTAKPPRA
jgi:membrane fusion protein (multidrug efflux system)